MNQLPTTNTSYGHNTIHNIPLIDFRWRVSRARALQTFTAQREFYVFPETRDEFQSIKRPGKFAIGPISCEERLPYKAVHTPRIIVQAVRYEKPNGGKKPCNLYAMPGAFQISRCGAQSVHTRMRTPRIPIGALPPLIRTHCFTADIALFTAPLNYT